MTALAVTALQAMLAQLDDGPQVGRPHKVEVRLDDLSKRCTFGFTDTELPLVLAQMRETRPSRTSGA